MLTTLFIAVGLAMDAFAVSISSGVAMKRISVLHALRIAFAFGFMQAVMPIIGWYAGSELGKLISGVDHWVAFVLLTLIGGRMMRESLHKEPASRSFDPLHPPHLLLLSLATSLDALAVGLGLAFARVPILSAAAMIGVITFSLSYLGVFAGDRLECQCERRAELYGGMILIGIGAKILIEHLLH